MCRGGGMRHTECRLVFLCIRTEQAMQTYNKTTRARAFGANFARIRQPNETAVNIDRYHVMFRGGYSHFICLVDSGRQPERNKCPNELDVMSLTR